VIVTLLLLWLVISVLTALVVGPVVRIGLGEDRPAGT
jgi:hypothetical protein